MPAGLASAPPSAAIFGLAGRQLGSWERGFFRETRPLGFILFRRNVVDRDQVRTLVQALRETVDDDRAPVLIDQEGGRVQRLRPPAWRALPPAEIFGRLAERDRSAGRRAAWLNARLIAADLAELGIDFDCLPCLDLRHAEAHDVIGDRAFASDPDLVAELGRATAEGLLAGGVMPVIKHIPGHGRALVDSHHGLPRVTASLGELEDTDFLPFRRLADLPWAMTAHVVYSRIDAERPCTTSPTVIGEIVRGHIGFDGVLLSDDISMQALDGDMRQRSAAALAAGCDLVLHCNGERTEMERVAAGVRALSRESLQRLQRGRPPPADAEFDAAAGLAEFETLLAG